MYFLFVKNKWLKQCRKQNQLEYDEGISSLNEYNQRYKMKSDYNIFNFKSNKCYNFMIEILDSRKILIYNYDIHTFCYNVLNILNE